MSGSTAKREARQMTKAAWRGEGWKARDPKQGKIDQEAKLEVLGWQQALGFDLAYSSWTADICLRGTVVFCKLVSMCVFAVHFKE